MTTMRLLLKDNITRGEVVYMALDYEWQQYSTEEATVRQGFDRIWLEGDGENQSVIIYTEDALVGLRYFSVQGGSAAIVADRIRASVDVYTRDELEAGIAHAGRHDEWIQAITKLGVSLSQTFELWAFETLGKGLAHADPRVRLATIAAFGFPAWRELIEPLRRVHERDPDHRVVSRAARMIGLLVQATTPGSEGTASI